MQFKNPILFLFLALLLLCSQCVVAAPRGNREEVGHIPEDLVFQPPFIFTYFVSFTMLYMLSIHNSKMEFSHQIKTHSKLLNKETNL